jgi:hypothetical protein
MERGTDMYTVTDMDTDIPMDMDTNTGSEHRNFENVCAVATSYQEELLFNYDISKLHVITGN